MKLECSICSHVFEGNKHECPKCGSGEAIEYFEVFCDVCGWFGLDEDLEWSDDENDCCPACGAEIEGG